MKIIDKEHVIEFGVKREDLKYIKIEINGGDQSFLLHEDDGTLVVRKIDVTLPHEMPMEGMSVFPVSRAAIAVR